MKLHRRIIGLVGLGMLLILAITATALQELTTVFLRTAHDVQNLSEQVRRIWEVEQKINEMHIAVHGIVETGDAQYRASYEKARTAVHDAFRSMSQVSVGQQEMKVLSSLMTDFGEMERKSERAIALAGMKGTPRTVTGILLLELDSLQQWMANDIAKYREENSGLSRMVMSRLQRDKIEISVLFIVILGSTIGFLLIFGTYLYRRVSVPLNDLWTGTEAITQGNLDHRIPISPHSEIARLAERFNDMAGKLKSSHDELEQRLLDRIQKLAALDSVALALGKSGGLNEMLQTALRLVVTKMADLEPKGGIFLCGERLRLTVHTGLSPEFVEQEGTIGMGECLCGHVAQSGEILFTDSACRDSRHTRMTADPDKGHSHIILPLTSRGIVLGVMFLYPGHAYSLKPSDIQLLDSIGAQLGMAIENFRLYSEVKESSEKYWDLFEHSHDILCILDTDGRFTVVNKAAETFLGASKIELTGRSVFDFLSESAAATVRRVLAGDRQERRQSFELEIKKGDGSSAFVEVRGRRIARERIATGYQVAVRDVTEQKRLRKMLLEAERLAAICQVGIAVRHEINNPLTTVIGNAELLLERTGEGDAELQKRLEVILNNALRIAQIVKQLEGIRKEKVVEYLEGVKMTDIKEG